MNHEHAKLIEYLQEFSFILKHKLEIENKPLDALSRVALVISSLEFQILGFETLKEDYKSSHDFNIIYLEHEAKSLTFNSSFIIIDGYLFKDKRLCTPRTSMRDFLIIELHSGGIAKHFGKSKIQDLVEKMILLAFFKKRCWTIYK